MSRKKNKQEIIVIDNCPGFEKGKFMQVVLPVNEKYFYEMSFSFHDEHMLVKYAYKKYMEPSGKLKCRMGWQVIEIGGHIPDQIIFDLKGKVIDDHPGNLKKRV